RSLHGGLRRRAPARARGHPRCPRQGRRRGHRPRRDRGAAVRALASGAIPMHVEIWSDIACPWCYVGKRRFEAALAAFEHRDEVTVTWRSFELDPSAPREREGDGAAHLARKYGTSREQALAMHQRMTATAAEDG